MLTSLSLYFDSRMAQSKNFWLSHITSPQTAMRTDMIWCIHDHPIVSWDSIPPITLLPNMPPHNGTWHLILGVGALVQVIPPSQSFHVMYLPSLFLTGSSIQWPHCHTGPAVWLCMDRGVTGLLCFLLMREKLIWNHISKYNSLYAAP